VVQKVNAASIPRSERIYGRAICEAADLAGDIVRIRGNKVGHQFLVKKVTPSELDDFPAAGVIIRKDASTDCVVQFHGPCKALYATLLYGQPYYVGTDSRPSGVGWGNWPLADGSNFFQQIGIATSDTEILLNFLTPEILPPFAAGIRFFQQGLSGAINGVNTVFTTTGFFRHGGFDTECVHYNGVRLFEGIGNDYVASESGGPGTGYDTITTNFAARTGHVLVIDYTPDI
jgi:hypothetical protein